MGRAQGPSWYVIYWQRVIFPAPQQLTNVGGTLFFTAYNSTYGEELWKSNGTSAGTLFVRDINVGNNGSAPSKLTDVNGTLFFLADDGTNGQELWKSNGTSAGTTIVRDVRPGPFGIYGSSLTNLGGKLFFVADDGTRGAELWSSNGTSAGTVLVSDVLPGAQGSGIASLTNVNGTLFFSANGGATLGQELWKTNGTSAGTVLVRNIAPGQYGSIPTNLTNVNGTLYFTADDVTTGADLWKSDGTSAGTVLIRDLNPGTHYYYPPYGGTPVGPYPNSSYAANLTNVAGVLYFSASDGTNGNELWKSDGTDAGTAMVKNLRAGSGGSFPQNFAVAGGKLFFVAEGTPGDRELWRSNGQTSIVLPSPLVELGSNPSQGVTIGGITYFAANDGSHGPELWKTDGTAAGTVMVGDILPGALGSSPTGLVNLNGTLYFSADDGSRGRELWKSNGTSAGTVLVKDIRVASVGSFPAQLTTVGNQLFFIANDGNTGAELWKSDGTSTGTVFVRDINTGVYYTQGYGPGGYPITYGPFPNPAGAANLMNFNGELFFSASDGVHGNELWKSNGTSAGTVMVRGDQAGEGYSYGTGTSFSPANLTIANGLLFFSADYPNMGREVWRTDGTTNGTFYVRDLRSGGDGSNPQNFYNLGGTLYFSANQGAQGTELWKTDGTYLGTTLVADIQPGTAGSAPSQLTGINGTLYFTADNGSSGRELWRSNGTAAGTSIVRNIRAGGSSTPEQMTVLQGLLYFTADDGSHGRELWQSNGSSAGTVLVRDFNLQESGSSIANIVVAPNSLMFTADDGLHGREPWLLRPEPNTAPVLDISKSPQLSNIIEDADVPSGPVGTPVSQLVNLAVPAGQLDNVTDPDNGALLGIAITGAASTKGTWYFTTNAGITWLPLGAVTDTASRLLAADPSTRLFFKPNANYSGTQTAAISFRAWDQTSGVSGLTANTTINGTSSAFSVQTDTASLTVTAVNDAPVVTDTTMNIGFIYEDQTGNPGARAGDITQFRVIDADSDAPLGIAITGLTSGNGTWKVSIDEGMTWSNIGVVSDTAALLLRSIDRLTFIPDAKNGTSATVTFRGWDETTGLRGSKVNVTTNGGSTAFSADSVLGLMTVFPSNDAPVLSGANNFPTINEDQTSNTGSTVASLIAGRVTDVDLDAVQGIAITQFFNSGGTWQYSLDAGATWTNIYSATVDAAFLLRPEDKLRFLPDTFNGATAGVTFRAWDQTTGTYGTTANTAQNGNTRAYSSAVATANMTVTSVNDAPVLLGGINPFTTISEDQTTNSGNFVWELISVHMSDVDTNAVQGIAITNLTLGSGIWQCSIDNGSSWSNIGNVSQTSALLLRSIDLIRFVPDGKNGTTASMQFQGWDQTTGTRGSKVNVTTAGGTTAFSSQSGTTSVTVTSLNDAPVLTGTTINLSSINEDQTTNAGHLIANFLTGHLTDVDVGAIFGIAITGLTGTPGFWQCSIDGGTTWSNIGNVSVTSALLLRSIDLIRFVPDAKNGTTATVQFQGWDQTIGLRGSKVNVTTAGGTTAFSTQMLTASLNVVSLNDAPTLSGSTMNLYSINEDQTNYGGHLIGNVLQGRLADVDVGALAGVAITGLSGVGTWQCSINGGSTWSNIGNVSVSSALLLRSIDLVRFVPDAKNGTSASFTFQGWDQSMGTRGSKVNVATAGGMTAYSLQSNTALLTVVSVNDAPILSGSTMNLSSITEDQTSNGGYLVGDIVQGRLTDVDAGAISGLAITGLVSGTGKWQCSIDGGSTWSNIGTVSTTSALLLRSLDLVRFVPDSQNGTTATLTFQGWDQTTGLRGSKVNVTTNGGTTAFSTGTVTAQLIVQSINDAPVLNSANNLTSINASQTNNAGDAVATLLTGKLSDVDAGALQGIAVTGLISNGGTWQYSLDTGATWTDVGSVSVELALLLRSTDRLRFVPSTDVATTAYVTFRGWDRTGETQGLRVNTTQAGLTTAYSLNQAASSISVTPA